MRFALVLAFVFAVVAALPHPHREPQRIVGGSVTTINVYPFAVSLLFSWNGNTFWQRCGGTILNNRSVLTAAHCVFGTARQSWRSRVGSTWANSGGVVHNTAQIIMHPQYDFRNLNMDFAILRLASNINMNNNVRAASIAGSNYNVADNQQVWAIGWGVTSFQGPASEQLRHVQIWTINQAVCRQRYAARGMVVNDNMMCSGWLDVGGRDQCQGDSGGPLIHNNVIVGVCSWGHQCANPRYPGINARVSRATSWITSNS